MTSGRDLFEPKLGLTMPLCGLHFVFYFLVQADPQRAFTLFAFDPASALTRPWTFLSYQFLHGDMLSLFFGTMVFYILGMALEAEWGTPEYVAFWLISTLGASGAAWFLGQALVSGSLVVNVSMLFAYAFLFPETRFLIFFVIPVKVKWMAWATAAFLGLRFVLQARNAGILPAIVEVSGAAAGFLFFWFRHHGRFHAKKVVRGTVDAVKTAGAVRQDEGLEKRNRALFPRVEALREATRAAGELPAEQQKLASELAKLVVPGVKICKPVDFKGDKDGICVRCEGFAECSLRYVAGQPAEIAVKKPDP